MLGNVDEYGKVKIAGGAVKDYISNPSNTIMAVSTQNPIASHYYLIKWAAEQEMKKHQLISDEESSEVIPDMSSRHQMVGNRLPAPHEVASARGKLKKSSHTSDEKPQQEEKGTPEFIGVLNRLKPSSSTSASSSSASSSSSSAARKDPKEETELSNTLSRLKPVAAGSGKAKKQEDALAISPVLYQRDLASMNSDLATAKEKQQKNPGSWAIGKLVQYIEQTIERYEEEVRKEKPQSIKWCVNATKSFVRDINQVILEERADSKNRDHSQYY